MTTSTLASIVQTVSDNIPPTKATVTGKVPSWLRGGRLLRVGPGMFDVGDRSSFKHWFDGLAMLHSFEFAEDANEVTYTGRFLETSVYKKSKAAGRLVGDLFGTRSSATTRSDPCETIFGRSLSQYTPSTPGRGSDNTNVNVLPSSSSSDKWIALAELTSVWQFDPVSLETKERVHIVGSNPELNRMITMTAHPHAASDGGMYNVGLLPGARSNASYYAIFKTDASEKYASELVCLLPAHDGLSYYHSFGITDRYFIFVESPLKLALWRAARSRDVSFADCMYWVHDKPSRFRLVDRKTSKEIVDVTYEADPFFCFHHVNAFEDDVNCRLVVDVVSYPNGKIALESASLEELRGGGKAVECDFRRFFLPLDATGVTKVESEVLSDRYALELPRINYESRNGRPYRFAYGLGLSSPWRTFHDGLIKLNTETKETLEFFEENMYASEPIFVEAPDPKTEDDGVVLTVFLSGNPDEKKPFLLVLDATSFEEIARAEFACRIPTTFHGNFLPAAR